MSATEAERILKGYPKRDRQAEAEGKAAREARGQLLQAPRKRKNKPKEPIPIKKYLATTLREIGNELLTHKFDEILKEVDSLCEWDRQDAARTLRLFFSSRMLEYAEKFWPSDIGYIDVTNA